MFPIIFLVLLCGTTGQESRDILSQLLSSLLNIAKPINKSPDENFPQYSRGVKKNLQDTFKPLKEKQLKNTIINGLGGTTIATYQPSSIQLIIKDNQYYVCINGKINEEIGECEGNLRKFVAIDDSDYCYLKTGLNLNNYICFPRPGYSKNIQFVAVNDEMSCRSDDSSRVFVIRKDLYRKMCKNISNGIYYKYFTRFLTTDTIVQGIDCNNVENDLTLCTYYDSNALEEKRNVLPLFN